MVRVWITWECQRRNRSISELVDAQLFELITEKSGIFRYFYLTWKTVIIILFKRPGILYVQNPSLILSVIAVTFGKLFSSKVVVDAHNVGVFFEHQNTIIRQIGQKINHLIFKLAHITIVSNIQLAQYVKGNGGSPYVLPDPFPKMRQKERIKLSGDFNVVCICTFSEDEPYIEIIEASLLLVNNHPGIHIYVTGNPKDKLLRTIIPSNMTLTGYLANQVYIDYLFSADAVIDLTYRDNCLVCGAYEAISAEKPLLLSDTKELKAYFRNSAIYTKLTVNDIKNNLILLSENSDILKANIPALKINRFNETRQRIDQLKTILATNL